MSTGSDPLGSLAVLTGGGDAAGMNAAVRSIVRTALAEGLDVHAVYEGFQGLVDGGDLIRPITSADVGGIIQLGGTVLGTARSPDFRTRDGLRRAARNLVERGIDALVVVGGDGSLTGSNEFREQWPSLLQELVDLGEIEPDVATAHPRLRLAGLVGSIDNDMFGTDMTIGADTALHRITEAVDAIQSTASSHQRSFVVEVMGRHCGYLALMGGLATGANFVLIPESPPEADNWEEAMCRTLWAGREIGRRSNIVMLAEGTCDANGTPITAQHVKDALERRIGEDTRVTILGHVQRGGSPSAFDRYLGTVLGHAAVRQLLDHPDDEPQLLGIRGHEIVRSALMDCVRTTRSIADVIARNDAATAMRMRGGSFEDSFALIRAMVKARPHPPRDDQRSLRLGILHAGGPAPGMNAAVRVAVRTAMDRGHTAVAIGNGFRGLAEGRLRDMDWMTVSGWVWRAGAELGTSRFVPRGAGLDHVVAQVEAGRIDGLLVVGGWAGYVAAHELHAHAHEVAGLSLPIVCVPASINNDLPATDLSIGSDTALNTIVRSVDMIKESAVASHRSFIVEVMGRECGYLALMGGMAAGAERVYLPEDGISLDDLRHDLDELRDGFARGKRRGLVIRSEHADDTYTTDFIRSLFEREADGMFDVRGAVLGHAQQGGVPSPFDRILATRFASAGVGHLIDQALAKTPESAMLGLRAGQLVVTALASFPDLVEPEAQRPLEQRWRGLGPLVDLMATARA